MSRRRPRDSRSHISEKADPNIQVVVAQQGVATPAQMPRNMRAYIQEGYRSNGTVFRVVGHIARSCAGIKWKHYTDETKKREIPNSELLQLWNNPSPKVSGTAFREAMIAYYCLTGNSYVLGINCITCAPITRRSKSITTGRCTTSSATSHRRAGTATRL